MPRIAVPVLLLVLALALSPGAIPAQAQTFSAGCSVPALIQAINDANADTTPDVVSLAPGCVYTLTAPSSTGFFGDAGLPLIASDLIIEGNGATIERSPDQATPPFRIIISAASSLTVRNVTIRNGRIVDNDLAVGGGIRSTDALHVVNSTISGNSVVSATLARGGGLFASGLMTVTGSNVTGNTATATTGSPFGGGAWAFGTLTITGSTFADNVSNSSNNLAIAAGAGTENNVVVTGSSFVNNDTTGSAATGSGVYGQMGVNIIDSTFSENDASALGNTGPGAQGGAAYSNSDIGVDNSTISDNSVSGVTGARGSGFYAFATSTVTRSTFNGNSASASSGPGEGGGAYSIGALTVSNSTFSGNSVSGTGNTAGGGSLSAAQTVASNVTFVANTSTGTGGGINSAGNGVVLSNSIVVNNTGGDCAAFSAITAAATNMDSDGSCGNAGTTNDAGLLPLAKNFPGGTPTHALEFDSPAVNAGGVCLNFDQRNVLRLQGNCDLGAYELSQSYADANCDGDTDGDDVVLLLLIAAGFELPDVSYAPCSQEWDSQPGTTVGDALFLRRAIAGLNQPPT